MAKMSPAGKFNAAEKSQFAPGGALSTPKKRMSRSESDFLLPSQRKYPYKVNGAVSCDLLRAAMSRAGQQKQTGVEKKAKALFQQHCAA